MSDDPEVRYWLDVQDLGPRGLEVLLSVVNEGEEVLVIRGASVEVSRDGRTLGLHQVGFEGMGRDGVLRLQQFEIAKGRFHQAREAEPAQLRFVVHVDCRRGDMPTTGRISRRIATGSFRKPGA